MALHGLRASDLFDPDANDTSTSHQPGSLSHTRRDVICDVNEAVLDSSVQVTPARCARSLRVGGSKDCRDLCFWLSAVPETRGVALNDT